jgi:hypothetical protein
MKRHDTQDPVTDPFPLNLSYATSYRYLLALFFLLFYMCYVQIQVFALVVPCVCNY